MLSKSTPTAMPNSYSFVAKKSDDPPSLSVLQTAASKHAAADDNNNAIAFRIVKGSLTANNKFYWGFGEKAPFNFHQCYPVDGTKSKLESSSSENTADTLAEYVHPVQWGIAEVTKSKVEGVDVGTKYLAMLPIGQSVSFKGAKLDPKDDKKLIVDRPATFAAYNTFTKIDKDDAMLDPKTSDLALACFPGITTGFGLYYRLLHTNCYGGVKNIVVTSASSKVALALAVALKQTDDKVFEGVKVIGYTSKSNVAFCESTKLFDRVLEYDELLSSKNEEESDYVVIDISGRGDIYDRNEEDPKSNIKKLLLVGNSSNTAEGKDTSTGLTMYAKIKMILSFMGVPLWLRSWMNPTQEMYLIFDEMVTLTKEWGKDKLEKEMLAFGKVFCKEAGNWIKIRNCDSEATIEKAFTDIMTGAVPPSETIALDSTKALSHRK